MEQQSAVPVHSKTKYKDNEEETEKPNNIENDGKEEEDNRGSQLIKRFSLDPKQIIALESGIFQVMKSDSTNNALVANANRQSVTDVPFSMESIFADNKNSNSNNIKSKGGKKFSCCSFKQKVEAAPSGPSSAYSIMNNSDKLLPPIESKAKNTLVIDLDETLVHSSFSEMKDSCFSFLLNIDPDPLVVSVKVRPFAEELINKLGDLYEIVIFSNSDQRYTDEVLNHIDTNKKVKHKLYRDSLVDLNGAEVKDLSLLNRELDRTIIIDNNSVSYLLHPYNAIPVSTWFKNMADEELKTIMEFLIENHKVTDIYTILVQK